MQGPGRTGQRDRHPGGGVCSYAALLSADQSPAPGGKPCTARRAGDTRGTRAGTGARAGRGRCRSGLRGGSGRAARTEGGTSAPCAAERPRKPAGTCTHRRRGRRRRALQDRLRRRGGHVQDQAAHNEVKVQRDADGRRRQSHSATCPFPAATRYQGLHRRRAGHRAAGPASRRGADPRARTRRQLPRGAVVRRLYHGRVRCSAKPCISGGRPPPGGRPIGHPGSNPLGPRAT